MYGFHLRHTTFIRSIAAASIPASLREALDRRHTLDAQQRTFRETATTRHHATPRARRPA